jgi:Predicted Zn-dependent peptidases
MRWIPCSCNTGCTNTPPGCSTLSCADTISTSISTSANGRKVSVAAVHATMRRLLSSFFTWPLYIPGSAVRISTNMCVPTKFSAPTPNRRPTTR